MPRLVLINGAPASGKSTLAKRYADDHLLTLVLDIDEVRAMLGAWKDEPGQAGLAARQLAVAMARTHLDAGHDVLVPQLLGKIPFVLELESVAQQQGASFVEIALVSETPEAAAGRFEQRSAAGESATHRDASHLVQSGGGQQLLHDYYVGVLDIVQQRPQTTVIKTQDGLIDEAYAAVVAAIDASR